MKLRITVEGKTYDVEVEVLEDSPSSVPTSSTPVVPSTTPQASVKSTPQQVAPAKKSEPSNNAEGGDNIFPSPLAGVIRAIKVKPGDSIAMDQELLILEAMKMETTLYSSRGGSIKAILANEGDTVQAGDPLLEFN